MEAVMKFSKSLLILVLLSFALTGCYTQLQYSQRMNRVVDERPSNNVADSRYDGDEYYGEDEYADDNYIPVYYKDYDAIATYVDCGCNPYQSYTLSYSPYYMGFGVSTYHSPAVWSPTWHIAFHTGYGYSSLYHGGIALRFLYSNHRYRHWAFHHYHFGHRYYSHWPYYYYSYYSPFYYDPFYYGYYGPYIQNNFYYGYPYVRGGFAGNIRRDANRRYGPRSDARTDGVRSRDTRDRGRSAISGANSRDDRRYGQRTRSVERSRARTTENVRQRSVTNPERSRTTVRSGTATRRGDGTTNGARTRSRVKDSRGNGNGNGNINGNAGAWIRSRVENRDRQLQRRAEEQSGNVARSPVGLRFLDRAEIQNRIRQQRAQHPDYGKSNKLIQKRNGIFRFFNDSRKSSASPRWNNRSSSPRRYSVPSSRPKVRSGSSTRSRSSVKGSRSRSSSSKGSRSSGSRSRSRGGGN